MGINKSNVALWCLTQIFFAYQFVLRVSPSLIVEELMQKFHINASSYGTLVALYYIGYAGMQIPTGIMLDRYGPRLVAMFSLFICFIGNLMFLSDDLTIATIGRFLVGAGSTAGFLSASKAASIGFPRKYYSYMMSFTFTFGYLGAIYGGKPIALLNQAFGWHNTLFCLNVFSLLIIAGLFVLKTPYKPEYDDQPSSIISDIKKVISQPHILLVCICGLLQVGPLEVFADTWGVNYLTQMYGIAKPQAAAFTSSIYFGICFGGPILTWVAEKYEQHYVISALCGVLMAIAFVCLLNYKLPPYLLFALMIGVGVCSGHQILIFAITCNRAPLHLTGVVTSVTNMTIMSGGSLFNFILGHLLDYNWNGQVINGLRVYEAAAYHNALSIFPITLIIGGIGLFLLGKKSKIKV
jgi:predicted MFS family arabinose efflux permease